MAVLIVGSLSLAACGSGLATSTPPTLGSVEATPEELALGAAASPNTSLAPDGATVSTEASPTVTTVVAVDEAAAAQEPIGPPLSPGSTAEQLLEVVADVHGPTLDVAGQMNRLVDFPAVPTALDTTIVEVRADVGTSRAGDRFVVTSEVVLTAAGPVDAHIDFYRTELAALGWTTTTATDAGLGPATTHRLSFEIPGSTFDQDDIELVVNPEGDGDASTRVHIRYVEVVEIDGDGSPRNRLDNWAGDLPLPPGYEVSGAAVQTSDLARRSLHYSLTVRYDGIAPTAVAGQLRGGLPGGGYTELQRPSMGRVLDTWVYLEHPLFDEARVSQHQVGSDTDPVVTSVNVDARVEF